MNFLDFYFFAEVTQKDRSLCLYNPKNVFFLVCANSNCWRHWTQREYAILFYFSL